MSQPSTKTCPGCGTVFTLRELVDSPDVEPLGMQVIDDGSTENLYYFNHASPTCGTTFVVPAIKFLPFISEPIPDDVLLGAEQCGGHCLVMEDLAACGAACQYAPFRRFLLSMRERRKSKLRSSANSERTRS